MIQQRRSIQLLLPGVILLGLLVGVALAMAARRRGANEDDDAGVVSHSVKTPAEDVLKYWTQEKMQSAKPAKMPEAKNLKPLKGGKKRSRRPRP